MNNQREIYEALLAGETLDNREFTVRLDPNGMTIDDEGDYICLTFARFKDWQIYKEPKWYENIPDGGVLCRNKMGYTFIVKVYIEGMEYPYKAIKSSEPEAIPLTKQEIQVFLSNAPEDV